MTVRLVALMSFVLLLSLAAFGLLMGHFQDSVLGEVERTASQVGRAALRSLESGNLPLHRDVSGMAQWVGTAEGQVAEAGQPMPTQMIMVVTDTLSEPERDGESRHTVRRVTARSNGVWVSEEPRQQETANSEANSQVEAVYKFRTDTVGLEGNSEFSEDMRRLAEESGAKLDCKESNGAAVDCPPMEIRRKAVLDGERSNPGLRETIYVSAAAVHVERDPALAQLILKIPRFQSENSAEVHSTMLSKFDELELPIPLQDYTDLFDRLRRRSLGVFFGVFLLGTAISAGIATRFTRPIRRLDAGIHRISAGDLDVEVDVEGKGEIARLGRAFNEMTGKLRSSRDRAREVVRQEKLSALGGLAAGVAHDVRNPLHSIGLTLQHLRETCRPGDERRAVEFDESMDILRGEVRRLDELVSNFLRFARSERKPRQPVDLGELLRETEQLIRKEAEWRGIEVQTALNLAVPAISADGEAIRSAVLNLVLNSFEAMPEGGRLRLSLGVEGSNVRVEIEDDGHGIAAEDQEKVFEFAYTTRKTGSGLGLAMVHQTIVEEHGGRVTLDSQRGVGTRVCLTLPIRPPEREESEEKEDAR